MSRSHLQEIVSQFSQQAIPFAQVPGHLDAMELLVELSKPTKDDLVLDVACGPGLVACEFARHAGQVTGIDITPAMIEQAARRQQELGLTNLTWTEGDVVPLPYPDDSFSLVITRYSFHHFLEPQRALAEMIRVCRPGGRVLVADVAIEPAKVEAYDRLEIMRDPSHTHALTTEEFSALMLASGLVDCRQGSYRVEIELEAQLKASFPKPGDKERLREMITADVGADSFGIAPRRAGDTIVYSVPIGVFVGRKLAV
ncbi:methyltransferase domain-containing protein [Geomonas sp. Red32]|uniref:class I SAM-dependent methyltransferase n=1 Tax=Geomonas sp. Red32 TaxID=2912856 RepID=UPI00202CF513|nr:methyltransferase domain-containing protein [Geomonas sp. Red32]MCM0083838.1 methyltransferase domain-containing protein [Geomonas sp. Red32]